MRDFWLEMLAVCVISAALALGGAQIIDTYRERQSRAESAARVAKWEKEHAVYLEDAERDRVNMNRLDKLLNRWEAKPTACACGENCKCVNCCCKVAK